jgi:ubiquinone/menaquinone biosynthesis C-methylase UbiE/DNA-binding MarR family transcriptional regulator
MVEQITQPDSLLAWMGCLADPTRLRLLRLLERNELGVAELCDVLQLPQSTVSRHLKVLSDQGWAKSRRQGTNHLYQLLLDELEPSARKLWILAREQSDQWQTALHDAQRLQRILAERQSDSQAFFASAAEHWDKLRDEHYGHTFTIHALLAMLPPESVVADLGCGTGRAATLLSPYAGTVIGVDNSPAMLKAAHRRAASATNVELRLGNLEDLPIEAGTCDAALLLLGLTYLPDPAAALRESLRVLRPGGRVVIVDLISHDREDFRRQMDQRWPGFAPEAIQAMLQEAGYVSVAVRPLPPEAKVKGPGLFLATALRPANEDPTVQRNKF